jgi:hypothetical protein
MLNRLRKSPAPSEPDLSSPLAVDLLLTETAGLLSSIGRPTLYARLSALIGYPPGTSANIAVLAAHFEHPRQRLSSDASISWHEYTAPISETQVRPLLRGLYRIGFPQRLPRVNGVVDTSIGCTTISLLARINDEPPWTFSVSMQSSGFEGEDAEGLRDLCRRLFALTTYDAYDPVVYDDAGLERAEQTAQLAAEAAAEAVRRSNLKARTLTSTIDSEGLPCPHCHQHTSDIRFIDRSPDAESHFICGECGRSFVPADLERSD